MTGKKWFLVVAAVLFVGWIAYLGYAVAVHRLNPPDIVSRSQLVQAECVLVVDVSVENGKPNPTAVVKHRLNDLGPAVGSSVTVTNLPDATTPANAPLTSGAYMLCLAADGSAAGSFKLVGWPRGLGESVTPPGAEIPDGDGKPPKHVRPPVAVPWSESTQAQMKSLGYKW